MEARLKTPAEIGEAALLYGLDLEAVHVAAAQEGERQEKRLATSEIAYLGAIRAKTQWLGSDSFVPLIRIPAKILTIGR